MVKDSLMLQGETIKSSFLYRINKIVRLFERAASDPGGQLSEQSGFGCHSFISLGVVVRP